MDEIHTKILKELPRITTVLIKLSIFPKECKIAELKPRIRKVSKTNPRNCRPISFLPPSVQNYWEVNTLPTTRVPLKNGLFYKYQSGFRANVSTNLCLAQWPDVIVIGMEKGMYIGMILMNLQKVLDTLGHKILQEKISCCGLKTPVIKSFEFYASNRKFCIAQGSILLLVLFLIYINSLSQSFQKALIFMQMIHVFSTKTKCPQNWGCWKKGIPNTLQIVCW